jgi:hypothetical protein
MGFSNLCIRHRKVVGNLEIHIVVTRSGGRYFSVRKIGTLLVGDALPEEVASGSIQWGDDEPVRYDEGVEALGPDISDAILRASYDMYLPKPA